MGNIQFYNGAVLFSNGQVAMDPACCCTPPLIDCDAPALAGCDQCSCQSPRYYRLCISDATGDCAGINTDGRLSATYYVHQQAYLGEYKGSTLNPEGWTDPATNIGDTRALLTIGNTCGGTCHRCYGLTVERWDGEVWVECLAVSGTLGDNCTASGTTDPGGISWDIAPADRRSPNKFSATFTSLVWHSVPYRGDYAFGWQRNFWLGPNSFTDSLTQYASCAWKGPNHDNWIRSKVYDTYDDAVADTNAIGSMIGPASVLFVAGATICGTARPWALTIVGSAATLEWGEVGSLLPSLTAATAWGFDDPTCVMCLTGGTADAEGDECTPENFTASTPHFYATGPASVVPDYT